MSNIEFGLTLHNRGDGERFVVDLIRLAAETYRTPGRTIYCEARIMGQS
jgi:hypothetical protein